MMTPMNRTNGSRAWKIFVGVLATVLIILFAAEFGLRAWVANRVESEFAATAPAATSDSAKISFGSTPLTLGLLRGTVPHVALSVPSTLQLTDGRYEGNPAATVHMDNLRQTDAGSVAENFDVVTNLPDAFVKTILQQQLGTALDQVPGVPADVLKNFVSVSSVASNPADGTVTVQFTSDLAAITLRPQMEGDQLTFSADSTRLFGIDLPGGVTDRISQALRDAMRDAVFGNMRVRDVTVIEGGIRVSLTGNDVNLNQLGAAL